MPFLFFCLISNYTQMEPIRIILLSSYYLSIIISVAIFMAILRRTASTMKKKLYIIPSLLFSIAVPMTGIILLNSTIEKYFAEWYSMIWNSHLAYPTWFLFYIWSSIIILIIDTLLFRYKSKDKKKQSG